MTLSPVPLASGPPSSAPVGSAPVGSAPVAASVVLRLRLIGQMEAWTLNSESVLPAGRKTRALLAVIALSAPRAAMRGRLAELLWSRRPEEQARASLRQEIHRLLDVLSPAGEDILLVTRDHLQLRPGAVWVDVEEVAKATVGDPTSLSLLDGELLDDLDGIDPAFDAWLASERERLRDRARTLAEALLRGQPDPEAAIPAAQQLLAIDRAHEGAWRALMRAHAVRGERGMAIQAYERCRAVLADLLDASPSSETQQLLSEIRGPSGRAFARGRPAAPPAAPPASPAAALLPGAPPETPAPVGNELDEPLDAEPAEYASEFTDEEPPERTELQPTRGGARIGVMLLQMVGGGTEDAHIAPGLAEEITTALARFRWMFVVLLGGIDRLPPSQRDEKSLRQTFGIDFLLDGSVQRVGSRLRVTVRLLDLRNASQVVWARRFDRQAHDLLLLQDEIASEVVAQVDPEILLIEARRVSARPLVDATAYDLVLRAVPLINRLERDTYDQAGRYLNEAITLDPEYGAAHAWYAYWYMFLVGQGWAEKPREALEKAGSLAERAITLDPHDAQGLTIAGHVRAFLHHRLREAIALHERALSLNPNLAMAWNLSGVAYAYLGDFDEAEQRISRYKKLSPLDPRAFFYDTAFVIVALMKRDYEAAVASGRQVTEMNPSFSAACKPYLSALGHLGHMQEAAVVRRRLMAIEPSFTIQRFLAATPFDRVQDREHFATGLRLAGVPAGGEG